MAFHLFSCRMDTDALIRESRAEGLIETLGFKTVVGKDCMKQQLRLFTSDTTTLQRRQKAINDLRVAIHRDGLKEKFEACFTEIGSLESSLEGFFKRSDVETNSYQQILFSGWKATETLDTVPFILLLVSYFKQYAVPFLAIMTPLFMIILPYLALRVWYNLPITVEEYSNVLLNTMGFQPGKPIELKQLVQAFFTLISLGQSIYQPIQNSYHVAHIDKDMVEKGQAIGKVSAALECLREWMPEHRRPANVLEVWTADPRKSFASAWDLPFRLRLALQSIGDIEVLYRLAACEDLQPVKFVSCSRPFLLVRGGLDPFLDATVRVPFDFRTKQTHSLLTGPNRGGKSSVLRSLLLSVYMAQTFGYGFFMSQMILKPFSWIATGLRLEDRPGSSSMFESEVEFAKSILVKASQTQSQSQVGLVLFDELFHSTNPPDGERTADIFLQQLWKKTNVVSVISTHVFSLVERSGPSIQRLSVPAFKDSSGNLQFTYTLGTGLCKESSVDMILKEKGLLL